MLLFLLVICYVIPPCEFKPLDPGDEQAFRTFIQTVMACKRNVGATVALVRAGEVVFADGFGYRELNQQLPMDNETRINIGSLTKAFTATLAADVVSKGLVAWDTPLRDILGDDFQLEGDFRSERVCLRDLLSHKLGLPNYWGVSTASLDIPRSELVRRIGFFPNIYDFRSNYKYSNYPFVLAGWLTEVLTNLTWEQHIHQAIFQPLGMTRSRVSAELDDEDWLSTAYSYIYLSDGTYSRNPEKEQLSFISEIGPAGGIFSSALDMAKWMNFHLSGGRNENGSQVIPSSHLYSTYTPTFQGDWSTRTKKPFYPVDDVSFTYALGWRNGMYRGYEKLYHTGSYSSYNCKLTLLPEAGQLGLWACVNSPGDGRATDALNGITHYGLDLLLGEEPWVNGSTVCSASSSDSDSLHEINVPSIADTEHVNSDFIRFRPNDDYIGNYEHPGFGTFAVYENSTSSSLRYSFGRLLQGNLSPMPGTNDSFYMTIEFPLDYRMAFFASYPNGFPVHFSDQYQNGTIDSVQVLYLEFDLPPVFVKYK